MEPSAHPTDEAIATGTADVRTYLAALGDIALAGEVSLDELLPRIVELARTLLHARYAALGVFDARGKVTRFYTAGIDDRERRQIGAFPVGAGLLGYIVRERRVVRLPRIADHPSSVGFPPHHPPMTSFLGGPISRGDVVYGNLYLTDRLGAAEFTAEDAELLRLLARQSAIAIENAQRFARARIERTSLEAIFDSLRDAVFTTDPDGRVVRLNRQARDWAPDGALGQPAELVFPLVDELGRPVAEGKPLDRPREAEQPETFLGTAEGVMIPVEHLVAPILDPDGQVQGSVQVLRDLRPQREVEQLKANIISLVSHELRTPLSHIKGYASSLLQPDVQWDDATQRDFIAGIERQADRLARLIGDLLEISRLDAGGTAKLEPIAIAPVALVQRGLRQAGPNATGHPIRTDIPPDLPFVRADPAHLERVLSNLIENAAKYSPDGAPINVAVSATGDFVTFAVADRGSGLTGEEQSHLFERFYRSPRVKHRTPGTGLGLAICKEIVQAHGGTIWAESAEGEGSTFRFTLPVAKGS
ncbi:MAG TPA: ATP-binding protein [Chloroflexota bacterium]|nr:ATP-binding protein [Chloroflexota bacterium]